MSFRIKDQHKFDKITAALASFPDGEYPLVGLSNETRRSVLAAQLLDSIRRIEYLNTVSARSKSPSLHTPYSGSFEPFGGAAVLYNAGAMDDAYWLVYLATHFGKHKHDAWNLTEDIYGRFGQGGVWDWAAASQNPQAFSQWLATVHPGLTRAGRSRRFGNHRKFETLKAGPKGTGHAVATYVSWVMERGSHGALIQHVRGEVGQNPQGVFAYLYKDLAGC